MRQTPFEPADRRAAVLLETLAVLAWGALFAGAAYVGGQWLLHLLTGALTMSPPILHAV